jgi:dTDP-4-amino-4,6-dideoxygalactose transaminase
MDAIEIGLRANGIGRGDEVITTPITAFATILAILRAGATPVLADVDADTGLLDLSSVARCITSRTRAVLLVHLYGRVADMLQWTEFCASHGIALLEDCAQAHGARWKGQPAGSFGLFGAYSFYPTKNLGALGDGGAVVSSTAEMDASVRMLRNYGQSKRYFHDHEGLNSRLDEIQAAILRVRLTWLDRFIARRRMIAGTYDSHIVNPHVRTIPASDPAESYVYHLYVILSDERDRLASFMREQGIETFIHYPVPAHHQKPTSTLARDPKGLPRAEHFSATCLSIPCHPQMSDSDVGSVIESVNAFS